MEFNIGDNTALKLPEADTRREALDEATRDAPPGAGDGLGSQTEPDEEGMAENAVETMSLTEAPASSKRGSSATDIDYDPRRRAMSQAGRAKMAGQPWQASPARRESTWLPLVVDPVATYALCCRDGTPSTACQTTREHRQLE